MMNDMRFNPAPSPAGSAPAEPPKAEAGRKKLSFRLPFNVKMLVWPLIVAALALGAWKAWSLLPDGEEKPAAAARSAPAGESDYYAVFLSDGEVYFGKMAENGEREMLLSDAYYLRTNGQPYKNFSQSQGLPAGSFSLVRLSDEMHGPTDEVHINSAHVLFYEKLREDSQVVELINKQR